MTNPFLDVIDSDLKQLFIDGIDTIITNLSIPCRIYYGNTKRTECPNCLQNIQTGRSAGVYNSGGPIPFSDGSVCPYCNGGGFVTTESSENINLIVLFDYKSWIMMPTSIRTPDGYVQTLSKVDSSAAKLKRAKEILFDTNLEKYNSNRFTRFGEPNPVGLGSDTYIITMWKKIE